MKARLNLAWLLLRYGWADTRFLEALSRVCRQLRKARILLNPTHEAADAFWASWRENGETHRHGYYESTWRAVNAAIKAGGVRTVDE